MTERHYAAAACDLDNTLLEGSDISPENISAVEKLKQRGTKVIIATGRNFHGASMYHRRLALGTPTVTNDGALVSVPNGLIIAERYLPRDASAQIIEQAAARGVSCLLYSKHGVRVTSKFDWHENMQRHFEDMGSYCRFAKPRSMVAKPVYKTLLFSIDAARLDDFQSLILSENADAVDIIRNNPHALEFIDKGVTKVSGLEQVAEYCGFEPSQAVAFGDGANDVGMFRWAGLSVCMHHGHEVAKLAATMVAPATDIAVNFAAAVDMALAHP